MNGGFRVNHKIMDYPQIGWSNTTSAWQRGWRLTWTDKLRVFIAVDIDDPLILSKLERIKDALISTNVPMKPVETNNIHITIRFIGETPSWKVEEIERRVLSGLSMKPFKITLHGIGAFPSTNRPRVVWIGVSKGADKLKEIRDYIEEGLWKIGFPKERQKFIPHATLARIKGSRNIHALSRLIREYEDYEFGSMTVEAVRLKKSTLTRSGPIYETLWEAKLC